MIAVNKAAAEFGDTKPAVSLVKPPVPTQFKEYFHIQNAWDAGWYAGVSRAILTVRSVRTKDPEPVMYFNTADCIRQAEARLHGDMAGYEAYMARRKAAG
jgi:hypothetical protein